MNRIQPSRSFANSTYSRSLTALTIKLLLAIGSLALMTVNASSKAIGQQPSKLNSYFTEYLQQAFAMRPIEATALGDHRFDHLMDDVSKEARAKWLAHWKQTLAELPNVVTFNELSPSEQVDYQIFRDELIRNIWLAENTRPFAEDARVFGRYISDSVYSLLTQSTLPMDVNLRNAISRIKEIPRVITEAKSAIENPPRSILDTAILQNKGAIAFYEKEIFAIAGQTTQSDELKKVTTTAVDALKDYQTFLEGEVSGRATGQWRLGKELFSKKLELELDLGVSADSLLADAEAEFDRVQDEMYVVARQLWSRYFPKKTLPPDDAAGQRQTIADVTSAVAQEHGKAETLVLDARDTVQSIKQFIHEHDILTLPDPDRCQIIEMPEFRRGNSLAYLDSALPLDPNGSSYYAVSPPLTIWGAAKVKSFLEEYNRHMLKVLTIHEAYPGHYVQLEYSNRCPSLIRRVLQSGVFIEGWAVYTEQMMLDQGFGEGDLALRLNQLKFYLRAVANAILDHKMHCTSMSDSEALSFLVLEAYQSESEARLKIIRAKQSSVQLSTYFAGRMAHYRLRQQIQRELEDKFDLGRYHEAVLDHGSVPMKYLPDLVRKRLSEPR